MELNATSLAFGSQLLSFVFARMRSRAPKHLQALLVQCVRVSHRRSLLPFSSAWWTVPSCVYRGRGLPTCFPGGPPPPPLFFPIRPLAWPGFWGGVVCLGGGRGGGNAFAVGRRGQIHHNISRTRRTAPGIWLLAGINEGNIPHTGMARRSGLHPIEWREANRASSTGRAVACRHVLSRRPVSDEDDVQHVHPCRAQSIWEKGCGVVARHRAIGQKMTMTGKDMELP